MKIRMLSVFIIGALAGSASLWFVLREPLNDSDTSEDTTVTFTDTEGDTDTVTITEELKKVAFSNMYRGDGTGNVYDDNPDHPELILVESEEEYAQLWHELFSTTLTPPRTEIDFNQQFVVILMTERKENAGHLLTITNIERKDGKFLITASDKGPGEGCTTSPTHTRPVHVVSVARSSDDTAEAAYSIEMTRGAPCRVQLSP